MLRAHANPASDTGGEHRGGAIYREPPAWQVSTWERLRGQMIEDRRSALPAAAEMPESPPPATGHAVSSPPQLKLNHGFETHSLPALARRYPRGFSFFSQFPQLDSLITLTWIRSEFVHGILHEVLWEREAPSHRFSIQSPHPKRREDAYALQKSRDCGTRPPVNLALAIRACSAALPEGFHPKSLSRAQENPVPAHMSPVYEPDVAPARVPTDPVVKLADARSQLQSP